MRRDTLEHHGIKGQKWGTRNAEWYPISAYNKNPYRKRAFDANKTKKDVDSIISSMSLKDKKLLDLDIGAIDEYLSPEQGEAVIHRTLIKVGDTPVAFFDILQDDSSNLVTSVGTRSGKEYRGKGYATQAVKEGLKWYDENKESLDNPNLTWGAYSKNEKSINLAKKVGFKEEKKDDKWTTLRYK